jgi:hypothetical protein
MERVFMSTNRTPEILPEIAADYIHLAQEADGNIDPARRKRYDWIMRLAECQLPAVPSRQAWAERPRKPKT